MDLDRHCHHLLATAGTVAARPPLEHEKVGTPFPTK